MYKGNDLKGVPPYEHDRRFLEFTKGEETELCNNIGAYDTKKKKVFLEPTTGGIIEWSEDVIEVYERVGFCGADFWQHYVNSEGEELYPGMLNKGLILLSNQTGTAFQLLGYLNLLNLLMVDVLMGTRAISEKKATEWRI